ncbi:TPA: UilS family quorum-quenching N-acyl-homoserine lactonase, partial [Escherichia coli]
MKITDHKLSEGIALTFRVPEGNIKHPLIILCHGLCGIRNVLLPCFANAFTEAGFAT